ncbi:MAG: PAS domain-containing sensor histidine kinase [Proteobacteria bacterium]|nr:PAS domain-containing sensor histidine kinase [Pseudomonadota bacterium]
MPSSSSHFPATLFGRFKQSVRDRLTAASETQGRVRAEAELERFFAQSNVLLAVADSHGIFRKVNPVWEKVLGFPAEDLLSRPFIEFVHPSDFAHTQVELEKLREPGHQTQNLLNRYRCKDGSYRWLQWNAVNDPQGSLAYVSAVDVTDQQEIERLKEQFISTASHELRTPVTAINASLKLLASGLTGTIPLESARMVQIAERNSERLIRLVNDMLDIDQLQAGRMSFRDERVDQSSAVEAAIAEAAPLFDQADIHVETRLLPGTFVTADPDRLSQVMTNLLSNAAKFSPMSSLVEVSVEEVGDSARIVVRDHGAGISPSFRSKVFEKFAQAERGPGPHAGSGLGLSISKQFVQQMGGEIGVETPRDGGTRFFVLLPIVDRQAANAESGAEATRGPKTDLSR